MVAVRKIMEIWFFDKTELKYLDDVMPEFTLRKREDKKKALEEQVKHRSDVTVCSCKDSVISVCSSLG